MFKKTILSALKMAGRIHIQYFGNVHEIYQKGDPSQIVTKVDLESEQVIIETIKKKFPDHQIISEENGFSFADSEYTWIIDPLDGTSNYTSGIHWFGIMISVLKAMKPIVAAISLPLSKSFYFAELNAGAFLNNQRIKVSPDKELRDTLVAYSLDYSEEKKKFDRDISIFSSIVKHSRNVRSTNSLVDYCYTAEGKFGACINLTNKIWDIAAPMLLIKEAGGIVTDIEGNDLDLTIDQSNYSKEFACVCSNHVLHRQLIEIIKGCVDLYE